jgi:hypothetical protein
MGLDGLLGSSLPAWGWIPELGLEDATAVPSGASFSLSNPGSQRAKNRYVLGLTATAELNDS